MIPLFVFTFNISFGWWTTSTQLFAECGDFIDFVKPAEFSQSFLFSVVLLGVM